MRSSGGELVVEPGECCLYSFPNIRFRSFPDAAFQPTLSGLRVINQVLSSLVSIHPDVLAIRDWSGATILLALLVANTDEALEMVMHFYEKYPEELLHVHSAGLYCGENALHVLAVNRREKELVKLIRESCDSRIM